ncbi:MAG: hypothetical protein NHB32_07835 [Fischerella sp. CENA71]|nr:hypothetical protein [Fischerella sp. CENA71]
MIISDLNHIESIESSQVIGGCGGKYYDYRKAKNVAVAVAVAGDRKYYDDQYYDYKYKDY